LRAGEPCDRKRAFRSISRTEIDIRKDIGIVGVIAQLGERLHGMQEVSGSIPLTSTKHLFAWISVIERAF